MKILVSHLDLDGISVIVLCTYFNIEFDDIITLNYDECDSYNNIISTLRKDDTLVITDFSPSKPWMEILEKNEVNVEVYDHHGSMEEIDSAHYQLMNWKYPKLKYCYSNEMCGTELFYQNYITDHTNDMVNYYVKLVTIYDTGRKDHMLYHKAEELNRLFWKMKNWSKVDLSSYKYFIDGMIFKFNNPSMGFKWNRLEETKIEESKNREKEIFNNLISGGTKTIKTRKDEHGKYFCVIKLKSKASGISNMLLDKYSKLDYIIVINEFDSDNKKLSLRSRDTFNLTDLEGVKGHPCAAGFEDITNEICDKLWEGKIYSFKYKVKE